MCLQDLSFHGRFRVENMYSYDIGLKERLVNFGAAPPSWLGTAQNLLWCVICFSVQTELKRCLHSYQVMKHKTRIIEAGSTYIKDDTSRIKDELKALEVSVKLRSRYSIWMSLTKCKFMSEMTLTTFMFWVGKYFLFRAMAYYHWLFI